MRPEVAYNLRWCKFSGFVGGLPSENKNTFQRFQIDIGLVEHMKCFNERLILYSDLIDSFNL